MQKDVWSYAVLSDGTASVTGYTGEDTRVTIPSEIGGRTVTEIAYKAFFGNEDIVSVTIPDTVKKIGESAFCGCLCLSGLVIPESVEEIGEEAFFNCVCLSDDEGFVIIRDVLYEYYGESETVTVPEGIRVIGCYCFSNDNIKTVILPDSVCRIEESAFYLCKNLQRVDIPDPECEIDRYAFDGCPSFFGNDGS